MHSNYLKTDQFTGGGGGAGGKRGERERECVNTFLTLPIYMHTNPHSYIPEHVHASVCAFVYAFSTHTCTHTHIRALWHGRRLRGWRPWHVW